MYSVLGERLGLRLTVLDQYQHFLNLLRAGKKKIPIQNTNEDGFNSKHVKIIKHDEFDLSHLVCRVFHNRGCDKAESDNIIRAIEDYKKAIMINPEFPEAVHSLGDAKYILGELEEAIRLFDRAIELYEKSNAENKKEGLYNALLSRADAKDELGDSEGAIKDYNQIICGCVLVFDEYYRNYKHKKIVFKAFYNKGFVLSKLGRLEDAVSSYTKATKVYHGFAEPFFRIGELYEKLGKLREAIEYYKEGLSIRYPEQYIEIMFPEDIGSHREKIKERLYILEKKFEEEIEKGRRMLEEDIKKRNRRRNRRDSSDLSYRDSYRDIYNSTNEGIVSADVRRTFLDD